MIYHFVRGVELQMYCRLSAAAFRKGFHPSLQLHKLTNHHLLCSSGYINSFEVIFKHLKVLYWHCLLRRSYPFFSISTIPRFFQIVLHNATCSYPTRYIPVTFIYPCYLCVSISNLAFPCGCWFINFFVEWMVYLLNAQHSEKYRHEKVQYEMQNGITLVSYVFYV